MKKFIATMSLALSTSAFASGWASIDIDNVQGREGAKDSVAQYLRIGKSFGDTNMMIQGRTARFDGGGMVNSVETTFGHRKVNLAGIAPFAGLGYDNGYNGGNNFSYGLVGATYARPIGPAFAMLGVKTRVGSTQDGPRTKQTVSFATLSFPVTKDLSLNINASRSDQDIKETALGIGIGLRF